MVSLPNFGPLAMRLAILPLRGFTPLMIVIFLVNMWKTRRRGHFLRKLVEFWTKAEVWFYLWSIYKQFNLRNMCVAQTLLSSSERKKALSKWFESVDMVYRAGSGDASLKPLLTICSIANIANMKECFSSLSKKRQLSMENIMRYAEKPGHSQTLNLHRSSTVSESGRDLPDVSPKSSAALRKNSSPANFAAPYAGPMKASQLADSAALETRPIRPIAVESGNAGWMHVDASSSAQGCDSMSSDGVDDFRLLKQADFASWFDTTDINDVWRGNVEEWVAHYVFGRESTELDAQELKELQQLTDKVINFLELRPRSGYNKKVRGIMVLSDPMKFTHRPLLFYVIVRLCINSFDYIWSSRNSFRKFRSGTLLYWYRPASKPKSTRMPLVFVHGLGLGAATLYVPGFVKSCIDGLDGKHRDVIVLSLQQFQMRPGWESFIPSANEVVCCVKQIMQFHLVQHAHFIGHSSGTQVISWLANQTDLVKCSTMVDPVCILLLKADMITNNLYNVPKTISEAFLRYFVFEETTTASFTRRHILWHETMLQFDRCNFPICFMIGGSDPIIPGYSTYRLCEYQKALRQKTSAPRIEVLWEKGYNHGQFLLHGKDVIQTIRAVDKAAHEHLKATKG
eukprot:GEMP01005383.1.p1 GENE.GEMP01005383.1~~GEMP01005383.1.p1  ORF type:complete len:625 (+),score=76.62 GEMP01005383.1:36-1910(+)